MAAIVTTTPTLSVDGITKTFSAGPPWHRRKVAVLRGASLEVRPGEIVGHRLRPDSPLGPP